MRKAFILFVLIGVLVQTSNAQNGKVIEEFVLHQNAAISYDTVKWKHTSYRVVEGEFTVVEFKTNNGWDEGNFSETPTTIAFEIPDGVDRFSWTDHEIHAYNAVHVQACRCQDRGIQFVELGNISGVEVERGVWEISMDVISVGRNTGYEYRIVKSFICKY